MIDGLGLRPKPDFDEVPKRLRVSTWMASHGLLLRLFLSPGFFTVNVALQYLAKYSDNIGITYYLTRRLRNVDLAELENIWGFVCHLLVTRPSKSRALECFVVETAQRSSHIAVLTLYFMQTLLRDQHDHTTPSFSICRRTLQRCQELIFTDTPTNSSPYTSVANVALPKKISHNSEPALVGIGMVLAGAPALPILTSVMGPVAVEQGRAEDQAGNVERRTDDDDDDDGRVARVPSLNEINNVGAAEEEEEDPDISSEPSIMELVQAVPVRASDEQSSSLHKVSPLIRSLLKRRSTISAAQTSPSLVPARLSEDPFGQNDYTNPSPPIPTPSQSSPSLQNMKHKRNATSEHMLQQYNASVQGQMLRSHYCRSEMQFLQALENISHRLLIIPKAARVSALRAELTALNHKLPAEVCVPLWCSPTVHHRIVRIPPGESVALNSAQHAPYLLLVELLYDDLDFEPSKRQNRDILRKIINKQEDKFMFTRRRPVSPEIPSSSTREAGLALMSESIKSSSSDNEGEEEEVDLVEQVYKSRGEAQDLSESIVLPAPPKNKELDARTWRSATPTLAGQDSAAANTAAAVAASPHVLSLDEYSERMRTAAVMLAQLNSNLAHPPSAMHRSSSGSSGSGGLVGLGIMTAISSSSSADSNATSGSAGPSGKGNTHPSLRGGGAAPFAQAEAAAIRERIMKEMIALEDERMARMREGEEMQVGNSSRTGMGTAEDERIIRQELDKADPSAAVFSESWEAKKSRIRSASPYGHLTNWNCVSVIVKTGDDLRQEQLAVQLIQEFSRIWQEEQCQCWVRSFRILITGLTSGLVETITDAVSIHSIKKAEYARRLAEGRLESVTILDHFRNTYGDPSSARFARAQRNFARSLAGYSVITFLLQIKDRHNGNILLDRDGHLVHIDFGFMLSNSPGNIGFEAAPFKLPPEYIEVLGGVDAELFKDFKKMFKEGFEAARKHCDRIVTMVELMQKDSSLPCFAAFGEQTAAQLRDRFQPTLTHSLVGDYVDKLIDTSLGSNWTRLYDLYQYYSQSIL